MNMTDLELAHYMLGLVLYRAGGEQTFTPDEMDDIRKVVAGVTIGIDRKTSKVLLRVFTPEELEAKTRK